MDRSSCTWIDTLARIRAGPSEADNEQGQAATQQEPAQTFSFPIHIVEDEAAAKARESSEAEARQHDENDLVAQQGMNTATQAMNEATQRMANYAFWSAITVGVGTLLLVVTLWLTRQANKAAQEAVNVTREIGKKQVRAYIGVPSVEFSNWGLGQLAKIKVTIKNYGSTPARIFEAKVRIVIKPVQRGGTRSESTKWQSAQACLTTLNPSGKIGMEIDFGGILTQDVFDMQPQKKWHVVIEGIWECPKLCVWGSAHAVETGHLLNLSG